MGMPPVKAGAGSFFSCAGTVKDAVIANVIMDSLSSAKNFIDIHKYIQCYCCQLAVGPQLHEGHSQYKHNKYGIKLF